MFEKACQKKDYINIGSKNIKKGRQILIPSNTSQFQIQKPIYKLNTD